MESKTMQMKGYNIKMKDGYYVIKEQRVSEEGNPYETMSKTFSNEEYTLKWLSSNGYDYSVEDVLSDLKEDYFKNWNTQNLSRLRTANKRKEEKSL